jgi:hypothetical protein
MTGAWLVGVMLTAAPRVQVGVHLDVLQVAALGVSGGVSGRAGAFGLYLEAAHLPTRVIRGLFGPTHADPFEALTVGVLAGCRYYPLDGPFTPFLGLGLGGASFLVRPLDGPPREVAGSLWRAEAGLHWAPWTDSGEREAWWRKLWFGTSVSAVFLGIADAPAATPPVAVHPTALVGFWY